MLPRPFFLAALLLAASCGGGKQPLLDASPLPDQRAADLLRADRAPAPELRPDARADAGHRVLPGCVQGSFTAYLGNAHAHTSYSDGEKTPQEAFQYARFIGKLDFLIVTDHLEQLYIPLPGDRLSLCLSMAAAETVAGVFLADCGFEYATGMTPDFESSGHANIFFSPALLPAVQINFHEFYQSMIACPTCVGQLNHPGAGQWNTFEYYPAVADRIALLEMNSETAWDQLLVALDRGWRVSPMNNQDNHSANWGTANNRRSGVFAAGFDRQSFREAMLARRTFATNDRNAVVQVMADDICWMGSALSGAQAVALSVEARDPDPTDSFARLQVYGKGGKELSSFDCQGKSPCKASFVIQASQSPWFLVRAVQTDGDPLVAAPIWLAP